MTWSELSSRLKERFWAPVRSKSFRFLHLLRTGTIVARMITTTANGIKSHELQLLPVAVGGGSAAAGVLAAAAGVVVAAAGGLTVSDDVLAATAGAAVAAAGSADILR